MTLLLLTVSVAVLLLLGYGPVGLILDRRVPFPRLVALPPVGLGCFLLASHVLASTGLGGKSVATICAGGFFVAFIAAMLRGRPDRWELRDALAPYLVGLGALLVAAWPLVLWGYESYLGFGNSDAAFNLAVFEDMLEHPYGQAPAGSVSFWPNAQLAHIFGASYFAVLISVITAVDILNLHQVVLACLVFTLPFSVYLFSRVALRAQARRALVAACVCGSSSLVCYTFYLQSLGALTLMALLPAAVAFWCGGLQTRQPRLLLLAAFLSAGTWFGYYAAFPVLLLLLATITLVLVIRRIVPLSTAVVAGAMTVLLFLASYPRLAWATVERTFLEVGSARLQVNVEASEVLLSFAFSLTEQLLPFFWGMSIPPHAWNSPFGPPAVGFWLLLVLSALLLGWLILGLVTRNSSFPSEIRFSVAISLLVVAYYIARANAYGVFKLVAWFNPLWLSCFTVGALAFLTGAVRHRCPRVFLASLLVLLVALNLVWCFRLGAMSLPGGRLAGKNTLQVDGTDFRQLREIGAIVSRDAHLLVVISDPVVQRWVITYLRRWGLSAVPYLSLSAEEPDAYEEAAASGAESAQYFVTWSENAPDITVQRNLRPVWKSRKFQLLRANETRNLLACGRGWYRLEGDPKAPVSWQGRFRWLRSTGDVILFKPVDETLRLRLTAIVGHGAAGPDRELRLLVDGREFDRVVLSGSGSFVSKPFRAYGFRSRLTISVTGVAHPQARPAALVNRWVPKDPRRLNIAVTRIELLTEKEYQDLSPPCSYDASRAQPWEDQLLTGLYTDRWIAKEARLVLQACGQARALLLQGFVPGVSPSLFPLSLLIWANEAPLEPVTIANPGAITALIPLPDSMRRSQLYDIRIRPTKSFVVPSDRRPLSVRLERVELVPDTR